MKNYKKNNDIIRSSFIFIALFLKHSYNNNPLLHKVSWFIMIKDYQYRPKYQTL